MFCFFIYLGKLLARPGTHQIETAKSLIDKSPRAEDPPLSPQSVVKLYEAPSQVVSQSIPERPTPAICLEHTLYLQLNLLCLASGDCHNSACAWTQCGAQPALPPLLRFLLW